MKWSAQICARQSGATLVMTLLMLVVILLLGLHAAQLALQGEKTARNDRDRHLAFQAAESTLLDAEMDIEKSPDPEKSRSHLFAANSAIGFPAEAVCSAGAQSIYLGLCGVTSEGQTPVWQTVDFSDGPAGSVNSVPYGRFTGQSFPVGSGSLPAREPRYIIELMRDTKLGERADQIGYLYRITAIGFGANPNTQVVLQTIYRKAQYADK
jgi:type IV pilus assembly protein PilX